MPDLAARIAALPMELEKTKAVAACGAGTEYAYDCVLRDSKGMCHGALVECDELAIAELVGVIEELLGRRCETCGSVENCDVRRALFAYSEIHCGIARDFSCSLWEPS